MMADYSCDRLRAVIPSSTVLHLHSTMALPTITTPNSTLALPSISVITALTITPLPFNSRTTALNNTMINVHSTTALLHISIMTHTFALSVIIRFHITRHLIRRLNSPSIIKTSSDPHRSEVQCSLQAKRYM